MKPFMTLIALLSITSSAFGAENSFDQLSLCAKTAHQFSDKMGDSEKILVMHLCMDLGKSEDQIQWCSDTNKHIIGLANVARIDSFEQCLSATLK